MFDVFGNMQYEELNKTAEGLKNEGDTDNLKKLAEENGIDAMYAEMYAGGGLEEFCDAASAAIGKIDVEAGELKPVEIVSDWVEYIRTGCLDNEEFAVAVRRKDRTLKGCIAELLKWSFSNRYKVDKDVVKAAGVTGAGVEMGIPGMGTAKKLIREYYLK
jgi:hypothetical protein